jgi:hypothetical protein
MQERRARPINLLISCVRPPKRPLTDSRSLRVCVEDGSIAYSAVSQPSPEPLRQRGTPSTTLAAQSTRVRPHSINTEPAGHCWYPRVMRTSRNASSVRPSARATAPAYPGQPLMAAEPSNLKLSNVVVGIGADQLGRPAEDGLSFAQHFPGIGPRRHVGDQQPLHTRRGSSLTSIPSG